MNKVLKIEVLEPIMVNSVALNPFADFGEKRVREEARGARWFGSLTTLRTRSRSAGRSLAMRRGDGGRLAMDHAKDIVETGSIAEGHAYSMVWVVVLVGVAEWWNDGDSPTSEQSLYVPHFGTTILHHSHHTHNPSPPTPISTAPITTHPYINSTHMHPCPFNGSHQSPVIVSDPSIKPLTPDGLDQTPVIISPTSNDLSPYGFISLTLLISLLFSLSFVPTSHQMIAHSHSAPTHHPFTCPSLFVPIFG